MHSCKIMECHDTTGTSSKAVCLLCNTRILCSTCQTLPPAFGLNEQLQLVQKEVLLILPWSYMWGALELIALHYFVLLMAEQTTHVGSLQDSIFNLFMNCTFCCCISPRSGTVFWKAFATICCTKSSHYNPLLRSCFFLPTINKNQSSFWEWQKPARFHVQVRSTNVGNCSGSCCTTFSLNTKKNNLVFAWCFISGPCSLASQKLPRELLLKTTHCDILRVAACPVRILRIALQCFAMLSWHLSILLTVASPQELSW